jgi:hypothetical protein
MAYKKFEDAKEFGKLFGNHRFKRSYSDFINGLMQRLYQPEGKWGRLLGAAGNYGIIDTNISLAKAPMNDEIRDFYADVYDNIDPKWSLLNYVNTHWTSFMHVMNTVNYWIDTKQIKNEDIFTFDSDYIRELDRLKPILNRTGQFIFMPDHNLNVFWKIMGAIAKSTYIGNLGENKTLESLAHLGDITDVVKSQPGLRVDTHGGVDMSFKLDGIKKTLQCKSFTNVNFTSGQFIFKDISNPGWYNVDYFSFVNRRNIYVFDTRSEGLVYRYNDATQSYIFDQRLLKYKLDL